MVRIVDALDSTQVQIESYQPFTLDTHRVTQDGNDYAYDLGTTLGQNIIFENDIVSMALSAPVCLADATDPLYSKWLDNGVIRERIYQGTMTVGTATNDGKTYTGFATSNPVTTGSTFSTGSLTPTGVTRGTPWHCPIINDEPDCGTTISVIVFQTDGTVNNLFVNVNDSMPASYIVVIKGDTFPISNGQYNYQAGTCYGDSDSTFCVSTRTIFWRGVSLPTLASGDEVDVFIYKPYKVPAVAPTIPTDPDPVLFDAVWSTTMTVGTTVFDTTAETTTVTGFATLGLFDDLGSMANPTFTHAGQEQTVTALAHRTTSLKADPDGPKTHTLQLTATTHLPDELVLPFNGTPLHIGDADKTGTGVHTWTTDRPSTLTDGQTVPVELGQLFRTRLSKQLFTAQLTVDDGWSDDYHVVSDGGYGSEDWFRVNLEAGNRYRVRIDADDQGTRGAPRIAAIFDHTLMHRIVHTSANNPGAISAEFDVGQGRPAGDYYIHVRGGLAQGLSAYRLRVDLVP